MHMVRVGKLASWRIPEQEGPIPPGLGEHALAFISLDFAEERRKLLVAVLRCHGESVALCREKLTQDSHR